MNASRLDDAQAVLIIADDPAAIAASTEAVSLAGARLLGAATWLQAPDRIAGLAAPATILAETGAVSEEIIAEALPAIVSAAGAQNVALTFGAGRIGEVEFLIDTGAQMLCEAAVGDRVAALIMARGGGVSVVHDSREEATRLARINAEVARFTETLSQLARGPRSHEVALERADIVGDPHGDRAGRTLDIAVTAADLRRAIRARRLRDEAFGSTGLFEDPAWDMLLDLFAAELERRDVSVSSLCIAAAVPPTTALRWINKLIAAGLFERRPDALDRRRAYIALTPRAITALEEYFLALRRSGTSIA